MAEFSSQSVFKGRGLQPKKPKTTASFKFGNGFSRLFRVFSVFFGSSNLADSDLFNGFWLSGAIVGFYKTFAGLYRH